MVMQLQKEITLGCPQKQMTGKHFGIKKKWTFLKQWYRLFLKKTLLKKKNKTHQNNQEDWLYPGDSRATKD